MDPMLYISFASGLLFAFVGNWMARRRDAHTTLWTLAGFLFPPLLLILKMISPMSLLQGPMPPGWFPCRMW